jgi:hypothetical protein
VVTTAQTARKQWRTLEPYHGVIYFVPEADAAYAALGLEGRSGYFASRSAPMGAVTADVVVATFFNFAPDLVHRAMAGVWDRLRPADVVDARLGAADAALRRLLGDVFLTAPEMGEAADLAEEAARACPPNGRPLFAGHAALDWPAPAHLRLWHAITLLREFRGDGHVAALVLAGVDGCEALVLHGASGEVAPEVLQSTRAWPDDEWTAAVLRLEARGWLAEDGTLTDEGRAARAEIEQRTDEAATLPWLALGEGRCDRLRELVRPWSKALVGSGLFRG